MRNDLKIPNEIWHEMLNLPEAKRGAFISQECARVIVRLTKLLSMKQGDNIKVNFNCGDMKNFKYFGFTTKNRLLKNCQFQVEGKKFTFFLSEDGISAYGVQNNDYLRIMTIYEVLRQKYEKCCKQYAKNLSSWRKRK